MSNDILGVVVAQVQMINFALLGGEGLGKEDKFVFEQGPIGAHLNENNYCKNYFSVKTSLNMFDLFIFCGDSVTTKYAAEDSLKIDLRNKSKSTKKFRFPPHPALPDINPPPASLPGLSEAPLSGRCLYYYFH